MDVRGQESVVGQGEREVSPQDDHSQSGAPPPAGPEVVLVPAHPVTSGGSVDIGFETRLLSSGQPAVMAFTSLDRLIEELGEQQPWIAVSAVRVTETARAAGLPWVLDPTVDPSAPRWTVDELRQMTASKQSTGEQQHEYAAVTGRAAEAATVIVEIQTSAGSLTRALVFTVDGTFMVNPGQSVGVAPVLHRSDALAQLVGVLAPAEGTLSAEQIGDGFLKWLGGVENALDLQVGEFRKVGSIATVSSERAGRPRSVTIVHLVDGRSCVVGSSVAGATLLLLGRPDEAITEALAYIGLEDA